MHIPIQLFQEMMKNFKIRIFLGRFINLIEYLWLNNWNHY